MAYTHTSSALEKTLFLSFKRWPTWIGYITLIWSLLYGGLHLYWLLGGSGYPFQHDPKMGLFAAMVTYLPAQIGGIIFVILCLLGIGISIAVQQPGKIVIPSWLVLIYAWGFAATLLLFIPDISLIMTMAYMFLGHFSFNWPMLNQVICIIGALAWGFAAVAYRRKIHKACLDCGRKENDNEFALVRWGPQITYIAALAPLPFIAVRFSWAMGIPLGVDTQFIQDFTTINPMAQITALVFGVVCTCGGLLTLGLTQKWGEIFPRWFPFIGGKRVPILLAIIPASIVAIAVTAAGFVFTFSLLVVALQLVPVDGVLLNDIGGTVGPMIFWIPWGVSLGLATIAYYYRRRGQCARCGRV